PHRRRATIKQTFVPQFCVIAVPLLPSRPGHPGTSLRLGRFPCNYLPVGWLLGGGWRVRLGKDSSQLRPDRCGWSVMATGSYFFAQQRYGLCRSCAGLLGAPTRRGGPLVIRYLVGSVIIMDGWAYLREICGRTLRWACSVGHDVHLSLVCAGALMIWCSVHF